VKAEKKCHLNHIGGTGFQWGGLGKTVETDFGYGKRKALCKWDMRREETRMSSLRKNLNKLTLKSKFSEERYHGKETGSLSTEKKKITDRRSVLYVLMGQDPCEARL